MRSSIPLLLLCGTTLLSPTVAQTNVGGPISSNTTWDLAGSPYCVTRSIIVGNSATLTIDPGVTVKFDPGLGIDVGSTIFGTGTLDARGTTASPILFTSSAIQPNPGDWGSIRFTPSATNGTASTGSGLVHCVFEFGGASAPAVSATDVMPWIRDSTFRDNTNTGLDIVLPPSFPMATVSGCTFLRNTSGGAGGLRLSGASVQIVTENLVDSCISGRTGALVAASAGVSTRVERNTVTNCDTVFSPALFVQLRSGGTAEVRDNESSSNPETGMRVDAANSIVEDNCCANNAGIGLQVIAGATARVAGNEVVANRSGGLVYSPSNQIQSAIVEDNKIIGNTNSDGSRAGGLTVSHGGVGVPVTIRSNLIANNSGVVGGGILIAVIIPTMIGNTIANNIATQRGGGCAIDNSGLSTLTGNTFQYNFAGQRGGGLLLSAVGALSGNSFIANRADPNNAGEGGAIYAAVDGTDISSSTGPSPNRFAKNEAAIGEALHFCASGVLQAGGVVWDDWPLGQAEPTNLIHDFFSNSACGIVVRRNPAPRQPRFYDLGGALGNGGGTTPALTLSGGFTPGDNLTLTIDGLTPGATSGVFVSPSVAHIYFGCGLIIPTPSATLLMPAADMMGTTTQTLTIPTTLALNSCYHFQGAALDPSSPNGLFTLSNGMAALN